MPYDPRMLHWPGGIGMMGRRRPVRPQAPQRPKEWWEQSIRWPIGQSASQFAIPQRPKQPPPAGQLPGPSPP
jgi:hypothetical protein